MAAYEILEAIRFFGADWACYEDWDIAFESTVQQFNGLYPLKQVRHELKYILFEIARPYYLASHDEPLPKTLEEYNDMFK